MNHGKLRYKLSLLLPEVLKYEQESLVETRIDKARQSFIFGYKSALLLEEEELWPILKANPANHRGFAIEGIGMAYTLLSHLSKSSTKSYLTFLETCSSVEKMFYYIGVGWAAAKLNAHPNLFTINLAIKEVLAVWDGFGFYTGFFQSHKISETLFTDKSESSVQFFYLGLGRSFWFKHRGNVGLIANSITKINEDQRSWVWRGTGVACTFTGNSDCKNELIHASKNYYSEVELGSETAKEILFKLSNLNY